MENIVGFVGDPGAGKSQLATFGAMVALDMGMEVFANYPITYVSEITGKRAHYIDIGNFAEYLMENQIDPGSALLIIDEGVGAVNSRSSMSAFNKLMVAFAGQVRHYGIEMFIIQQIASQIDKSIRHIADIWIVARAIPRRTEFGAMIKDDTIKTKEVYKADYDYQIIYLSESRVVPFNMSYENGKFIHQYYDTFGKFAVPELLANKMKLQSAQKKIKSKNVRQAEDLAELIAKITEKRGLNNDNKSQSTDDDTT